MPRFKFPSRHHMVPAAAFATLAVVVAGCGSGSDATAHSAAVSLPATSATTTAAAATSGTPSAPASAKATKAAARIKSQWAALSTSNKITVSDVNLVAQARASTVKVYSSAKATSATGELRSPLPSGAPLVFLVQERSSGRLRVLLPVRPNESQGWIRASDVKLYQHNYRIVVSVGKHTLALYKAGKVVLRVPVGLGKTGTPTPGGVFYTKELLRPPNPKGDYGPYAFGLSGYSTVLTDFLGGDGEIGIHGTSDPNSVGKSVSHGCIRMSNANITKLARMLPLGVPVQIMR